MTQAPHATHRQENFRKHNAEATIIRTSAPSGVPTSLFPGRNVVAARHGPPKERGVRRLPAKAAHFAPAAVAANEEEAFNACAQRVLATTRNRDTEIRQGALRPSRASLHPTQSLQHGVGRIRDCPASWPDNQRVTPPWCRMDKQSGPGIADPRARTLNHCRMASKPPGTAAGPTYKSTAVGDTHLDSIERRNYL